MKRIFLILTLLIFSSTLFSQVSTTGKLTVYPTRTEVNAAFSTKKDTLTALNYFYSKGKINDKLLLPERTQFEIALKKMTGVDYHIPMMANGMISGSGTLMVDGTYYSAIYYVPDTCVITKFQWVTLTAQASYTGDNYNGIGLYSYDPVTKVHTKIAETVNDTELWKGLNATLCEKALPTPVIINPGFYSVKIIWNASATTTAPTIVSWTGVYSFQSVLFLHRMDVSRTSQTSLPTTEGYGDAGLSGSGAILGIFML